MAHSARGRRGASTDDTTHAERAAQKEKEGARGGGTRVQHVDAYGCTRSEPKEGAVCRLPAALLVVVLGVVITLATQPQAVRQLRVSGKCTWLAGWLAGGKCTWLAGWRLAGGKRTWLAGWLAGRGQHESRSRKEHT